MAFTAAKLIPINQALGRIGSLRLLISDTTSSQYLQSDLNFDQTRDSLLRSYEWNFAVVQAELAQISTLELDVEPHPSAWVVGDTITGLTSGATAEILTVTHGTEYEIIYLSGTFTDGERITNATVYDVVSEGIPVTSNSSTVTWHTEDDETSCGTGYPTVAAITPLFHYDYQYQLPEDFDRLTKNWRDRHHWTIQGHRLLTDHDEANIEYVKKAIDSTLWDTLFTEVFVCGLAIKFYYALAGTQTEAFAQRLERQYTQAMVRARTVCAAEINQTGESKWNNARFTSGLVAGITRVDARVQLL